MKMETEETDHKTAELTLAAVAMQYVNCPVCFSTMKPPIYQCYNGHLTCFNCIDKIDKCSECRVELPNKPKIRNIVLENICSNLPVDCENKADGCNAKLKAEFLKNHLQTCPYTPFNFCQNILGLKNCKLPVNVLDLLSHLEMCHSVASVNKNSLKIVLNFPVFPVRENLVFFEPLVITSMKIPILIRCIGFEGYISFTGLALSNCTEQQNIRLKFRVGQKSKKHAMEWSGCVHPYRTFTKINFSNSFRIPVDFLKELSQESDISGNQEVTPIYVFIWEESIFSHENEIHEEVHLFKQDSQQNPPSLKAPSPLPHSLSLQDVSPDVSSLLGTPEKSPGLRDLNLTSESIQEYLT
ncbi:E3 ubiquitin-protein ligase Siah2 [Pseudolycoriella hygida]|uniref:RING-type E3 ubiquitin transferase n=1 Tax=Pseudolycoriella hygida TaxID=35572 RepID=A0A9Q0N2J9_9DIPT|nr:E3 ubiquitin-protein ligase Siah2 [Pseudolycoriella hygida]